MTIELILTLAAVGVVVLVALGLLAIEMLLEGTEDITEFPAPKA